MGEVEVGDGAGQVGRKGIGQAASDQADILVAVDREAHARRRGSDVHGLGESVVEIKLESMAELLAQACVQGMVVGAADGPPSVHGKSLVIEEFTGAVVESQRPVEEIAARADVVA